MLADLLNESVTLTLNTWDSLRGQRTATPATTTTLASVQPMKAQRRLLYGMDASATAYTVYFDADPACGVGDTITRADGSVLGVLAPARDEAGRGTVYAVDAELHA